MGMEVGDGVCATIVTNGSVARVLPGNSSLGSRQLLVEDFL